MEEVVKAVFAIVDFVTSSIVVDVGILVLDSAGYGDVYFIVV